ncbi:MAG TPA: CPBP family intramembrane glutamic endopeptidase [Clostridia bacterium]|nr:CPBP family intramembrane glutamic endopeptidase [Clostridia bacterium]
MVKKIFVALGKAACYTLLFLGVQFAVGMVYAFVAGVHAALPYIFDNSMIDMDALMRSMADFLMEKALVIALISDVIVLGLVAVFFAARGRNVWRETHLKKGFPNLAIVPLVLGGACLAGFIGTMLDLLPIPESVWEQYESQSAMLGGTGALAIIASILVAPIAEEVFFRGLVYTRLRRAMPSIAAALISSLIFGLLHQQLIWVCYAFAVGLAMAAVFERTLSTRATIAVHLAFNLAGGYAFAGIKSGPVLAFGFAAGVALCWIWLCCICPYTKLHPEDF